MNERIRELANECYQAPEFDYEKFAKLIVKECVELFPERHYYYSGNAVKRNIKEHFGAE